MHRRKVISCNSMPLDFQQFPGLGLAASRLARGNHNVEATGPALALQTMVPAIPPAPQANGAMSYPLVFIMWLILPIIRPGDDILPGTILK